MEKELYIDASHPDETRVVLKSEHHIEADEGEGGVADDQACVFIDPYQGEPFSRGLEVNIRYRASSFKKVILDELTMNKKASICLFKKNPKADSDATLDKWIEFNRQDLEQNVKCYKA